MVRAEEWGLEKPLLTGSATTTTFTTTADAAVM
jgi:hypothetical protein